MDLSWSELLVVGIVALIFIGPKDLPGMFREFGRFMAKVRAMGREFSRAMDAAAKESGVKDVANDLRKVTSPKAMGLDTVRNAADKFEKWDPLKPAAKAATPAAATTSAATAAPASTPAVPPVTPLAAPTLGPATAELAQSVAAKKAASAEKVAKLREAKAAPAPKAEAAEPAPAPKRGGRVRKEPAAGDEA